MDNSIPNVKARYQAKMNLYTLCQSIADDIKTHCIKEDKLYKEKKQQ